MYITITASPLFYKQLHVSVFEKSYFIIVLQKISCTRQFESQLSLRSFALSFRVKDAKHFPSVSVQKCVNHRQNVTTDFQQLAYPTFFKKHVINWYCQNYQLGSLDIHLFVRVIITWDQGHEVLLPLHQSDEYIFYIIAKINVFQLTALKK